MAIYSSTLSSNSAVIDEPGGKSENFEIRFSGMRGSGRGKGNRLDGLSSGLDS